MNSRLSAVLDWIDETVCEWSVDPPADFGCSPTTTTDNATYAPIETIDEGPWHFPVDSVDSAYVVLVFLLAACGACLHWKRRQHDYEAIIEIK